MWPFRRKVKILELPAPVLDAAPLCPWCARTCQQAACLAWSDGTCLLLEGHRATGEVQRRRLENQGVRRGNHA